MPDSKNMIEKRIRPARKTQSICSLLEIRAWIYDDSDVLEPLARSVKRSCGIERWSLPARKDSEAERARVAPVPSRRTAHRARRRLVRNDDPVATASAGELPLLGLALVKAIRDLARSYHSADIPGRSSLPARPLWRRN